MNMAKTQNVLEFMTLKKAHNVLLIHGIWYGITVIAYALPMLLKTTNYTFWKLLTSKVS